MKAIRLFMLAALMAFAFSSANAQIHLPPHPPGPPGAPPRPHLNLHLRRPPPPKSPFRHRTVRRHRAVRHHRTYHHTVVHHR
ncbi:hypothetical protein [Mucilaginibacter paludis]|uniref:hypothetical protein n=1 Tax=Mucilaginibacter paludis TaxID=423351 RepID=UPI00145CD99B|nr:hypothetical protein [Mucilaginibacter paludis]